MDKGKTFFPSKWFKVYWTFRKYSYWSKNSVIMCWFKLLLWFGYRRPKSVIPKGVYCYTPDHEKNKDQYSTYYIIPCKYYLSFGKRYNGCTYTGRITDDFLFDDQCKICGENHGFNENLDNLKDKT